MVLGSATLALAGTAMAALGGFLATRKDTQFAVRVLGVFFIVRGLLNATNGSALLLAGLPGGDRYSAVLDTYSPALAIAIPFLVLLFASLYPRRRGLFGTNTTARRTLYAVTVLFSALVVIEPGTVSYKPALGRGPSWLVDAVPTTLLHALLPTSYLLAGMVFARDYVSEAPVPDREGLLFVIVGFVFDGAYLLGFVTRRVLTSSVPPEGALDLVRPWGILPLVTIVGILGLHAIRSQDSEERTKVGWTIVGILTPVALWLFVTYPGSLRAGSLELRWAINGLSVLVFPLLIVYGVLRHNLLGVDVDLPRRIRIGAAAIALVFVYAGVSLAARTQLGGVAGQTVAVLATGSLVLVAVYLARTSEFQAPGGLVGRGGAYLDREALDVYKGTLEEALATEDGRLSEGNERMLARMRERLGVTDREHALLRNALETPAVGDGKGSLLAPGNTIAGRYLVEEELAEGGQGAVHLAHDTQLNRSIVLKQLHRPDGDGSLDLSEEARRLGSIDHPCIVTVYDVLAVGDRVLLVMEYLRPGSLADRLQNDRLDLGAFRRVAMDALTALEVIHDEGMVHRDVKPGNLLLTEGGDAKLTDFGISHVTGNETTMGLDVGEPVGTLRYMSPEQAKGQPVDERSDLFSLATTLYEAYTGEPYVPVEPGESMVEVQMRVAALGPFDEEIDGPEGLEAWFGTALAPRPEDRFASAREMRQALTEALGEAGPPEPR